MENKEAPEVFFCCCEGSLCNKKFSYHPESQAQLTSENPLHLHCKGGKYPLKFMESLMLLTF